MHFNEKPKKAKSNRKTHSIKGKYGCGCGKYQIECDQLTAYMIPHFGKCPTIGGEILRCVMKLNNEYYRHLFHNTVVGAILYLEQYLLPHVTRNKKKHVSDALKFLKPMTEEGSYAYTAKLSSKSIKHKKVSQVIGSKLDLLMDAAIEFHLSSEKTKEINTMNWIDLQGEYDEDNDYLPEDLDENLFLLSPCNLDDFMMTEIEENIIDTLNANTSSTKSTTVTKSSKNTKVKKPKAKKISTTKKLKTSYRSPTTTAIVTTSTMNMKKRKVTPEPPNTYVPPSKKKGKTETHYKTRSYYSAMKERC